MTARIAVAALQPDAPPVGPARLARASGPKDDNGRRLLAAPMSDHPDAELAGDAIKMAAAAHGGRAMIDEVIFHTDRGS